MRITLHNDEIDQALKAYVSSVGISLDGKDVDINIIAGRGENGTSAELDVNPVSTKKTVSAVPKTKTKTKPKEDTPVAEVVKPTAVKDKPSLEPEVKVEEEVAEEVPVTSKSLFA
jgi:hypothetical protein